MPPTRKSSRARRTTLADVARHCGVSVATVSAILGGKSYCFASEATRQKVQTAATELNYQANVAAKALRGERTGVIGVVLSSLATATRVSLEKLAELEAAAAEQGIGVLVRSQAAMAAAERRGGRGLSLALPVDGVVFLSPGPADLTLLEDFREQQGLPCVVTECRTDRFASTGVDRRRAAYLQVQHLLALGRRKLAFILTSTEGEPGREKLQGYEDALAEHGLRMDQFPVVHRGAVSRRDGFSISRILTRQLLALGQDFDGLITMADIVAMGAIQTLQAARRPVPAEVAVVGFDDADYVPFLSVPLTTVHQPRAVGRVAFELLWEQIQAEPGDTPAPVHRWLEPELIVRASTVADTEQGHVDRLGPDDVAEGSSFLSVGE